jgi:phosphoglycolate phosphatase-like HAD superfamily hydrolase
LKVIIDFDGTLTAEEQQARALAERSLATLANDIIGVPRRELVEAYDTTQARLLEEPHRYWWEVNGLIASYCDEGAFILNTTTLQVMLRENDAYSRAVAAAFPEAEYDPVVDCTNYLFHRHTAELEPVFRPATRNVLTTLTRQPARDPVILTNSLGDKVKRHLGTLGLEEPVAVLGDTRQYAMDPDWPHRFSHPDLGEIQVWPLSEKRQVDLRRPAYYRALEEALEEDPEIAVVADTFSLPGALPLTMGLRFFLVRTRYTPAWCARITEAHAGGAVLDDLEELPAALDALIEPARHGGDNVA